MESKLSEFFKEAMASETLRVSFCRRFCMTDDDSLLVVVVVVVGRDSDLWVVLMRTCSTMSSSVLARLDQHSRAADIVRTAEMMRWGNEICGGGGGGGFIYLCSDMEKLCERESGSFLGSVEVLFN